MSDLPTGTVTFLFTDIEGSTTLWEQHPEAMRVALASHDRILESAIDDHGGKVFSRMGDGMAAAFASARQAIAAAVAAQQGLAGEAWPQPVGRLTARMGVHTGEGILVDGQYLNQPLNRCARLMAIGHGGQVLLSEMTEPLVRGGPPDGLRLVDLGEHRLRDLSEPIRVFQAHHPALRTKFPPLRSLGAFPGNLPLQLSSFIGRGEEVDRISASLRSSRLVTLIGVGGVGKTRLALQAAAEVLPRFKDGAWLCELASVRDPELVTDAVAGALRVTARPGWSLEDSLVAYLRDQELLLVLDNCEHLLRSVARLVVAIEAAGAGIRVLATSREGLNIRGEQLLIVPALGLPEDLGVDETSGECESVRLFTERARSLKADFNIDATNRADVLAICRRLDGVALAIELAAARTPAMSTGDLARRLDRRFRLLSGGERVAIERHQTLRAAIDWSYDLLSEPEQQLLIRLSVFAGGVTLEAAEEVCSGDPIETDDVFELLANLVARSLIAAETASETRYRLLETIRQYGEERLVESGETDALRSRHADHYAEFAGNATRGLYGPKQLEWGVRLAREHDNLLAAMTFALDTDDVDRAMRLLCAIPSPVNQVDNPVVFDPRPILALPGADLHPGSALALIESAQRAAMSGEYPLALELVDQAVETERRLGPGAHPLGLDLTTVGSMARAVALGSTGALAQAAELLVDSAERAIALGQYGFAAVCLGVGATQLAWVDPETAIARANEGLTLARRSAMPSAVGQNLRALAMAVAPSDPQHATALLTQADTVTSGAIGDLSLAVFASAHLADWPGVVRAADRMLDLDRRSGGTPLIVLLTTFNVIARCLAESQPEAAAILQGVVRGLPSQLRGASGTPMPPADRPRSNPFLELVTQIRRDTRAQVVSAIGELPLRALLAKGQTMDRDQASAFARAHIAEYLAADRRRTG